MAGAHGRFRGNHCGLPEFGRVHSTKASLLHRLNAVFRARGFLLASGDAAPWMKRVALAVGVGVARLSVRRLFAFDSLKRRGWVRDTRAVFSISGFMNLEQQGEQQRRHGAGCLRLRVLSGYHLVVVVSLGDVEVVVDAGAERGDEIAWT